MSIRKNIGWVSVSQIFKILSQAIVLLYLTSLIAPADYGVLAMALIIANFANIFGDIGTTALIIQKKNVSIDFYSFINKLNIVIGVAVMLIVIAISPLIVGYFNEPKLYGLLFLLSLGFPIISIGMIHKAFFERKEQFKLLAKIEVVANVSGLFLAIGFAKNNFGSYSLVLQTVFTSAIYSVLLLKFSKLKVLNVKLYQKEKISECFSFSSYLVLFNLVNYFFNNIGPMLIGRFFSAAILGAYSLAYKIMLFPLQSLTFVIGRTLLPHFSKDIDNLERNRDIFLSYSYFILALTSPLMVGVMVVSDEFIKIFFNNRWSAVGGLLLWMAPVAIIQSVQNTTSSVLTAYSKTSWLFYLGLLGAILMTISFSIGVFYDINTLVFLYFIANLINFVPAMWLSSKILKFTFIDIFNILYKTLIPALLMGGSIELISKVFILNNMYYHFFTSIILGVILYLFYFILFNISYVKKIIKVNKFIKRY